MFDVSVTTDVVTELVTLSEAKAHLHVDHADEDSYITSLIKETRKFVEGYCGISIGTQTRVWVFDSEDCLGEEVAYGPVQTLTTAERRIDYGSYQTMTVTSDYDLDGTLFKVFTPFLSGRWKLTYVAGYSSTNLPASLKKTWLKVIAYWFENRGDQQVQEIPSSLLLELNQHRRLNGI